MSRTILLVFVFALPLLARAEIVPADAGLARLDEGWRWLRIVEVPE